MQLERSAAVIGRILGGLGVLALIGAWITQVTQQPLFGMSQQHLSNDAIALELTCIAGLVDSLVHSKQL